MRERQILVKRDVVACMHRCRSLAPTGIKTIVESGAQSIGLAWKEGTNERLHKGTKRIKKWRDVEEGEGRGGLERD